MSYSSSQHRLYHRYKSAVATVMLCILFGTVNGTSCAQDHSSSSPNQVVPAVVPDYTPCITVEPDNERWWNDIVWYEIFVRSFYDSDGDGVGDFNGITQRLDYLQELGVGGVWLMPMMDSPSYHGYDVRDYYTVDAEYGTLEDFQNLLAEAEQRDIKIIIDLVLNHSSSQNRWFRESRSASSSFRNWYRWSDSKITQAQPWGGGSSWHNSGGDYYYGIFWSGMPDLNYRTPAVTLEMFDVIRYWIEDVGVDGFRLDAIKYLVESSDGSVQQDTEETFAWLQNFYCYYKGLDPDIFTVSEAWSESAKVVPYVEDKTDIAFEFTLASAILGSARDGNATSVRNTSSSVHALFPRNQYATFITNHDQNRIINQLQSGSKSEQTVLNQAKSAASLLLTLPGVPFLYYGEEVGIEGAKPDEDIRTPMHWDDTVHSGFTTGSPWRSVVSNYPTRNVAVMKQDESSLWNHYKNLIAARNSRASLRRGDIEYLSVTVDGEDSNDIVAFIRSEADEHTLVLINLTDNDIDNYSVSLAPTTALFDDNRSLVVSPLAVGGVFSSINNSTPITNGGGISAYQPNGTLAAYSTALFDITSEARSVNAKINIVNYPTAAVQVLAVPGLNQPAGVTQWSNTANKITVDRSGSGTLATPLQLKFSVQIFSVVASGTWERQWYNADTLIGNSIDGFGDIPHNFTVYIPYDGDATYTVTLDFGVNPVGISVDTE